MPNGTTDVCAVREVTEHGPSEVIVVVVYEMKSDNIDDQNDHFDHDEDR